MPRINRIRVTNIRYDTGQKLYPDLILDADSSDLLVVLANGGGKTLLLQLILQVVIPNATIKNRRISNLLASERYTGHILVEWLLDTPEKEYLLTGFCFTNGRDDQPIRYFNYIHHYTRANPIDIKNLPLVDNERGPIAYKELYDLLRGHAGANLQVFDQQRGAYQRELERFHIYTDEWEKIRVTNGSEGGVDDFFRGSRSTKNLLENVLIPTIEDVLFDTDDAKVEMARAFDQHRKSLLEIPQMKKNIQDFRATRKAAQDVINALKLYQGITTNLELARRKTAELWREFEHGQNEQLSTIDALTNRFEALRRSKAEVDWKVASYRYFETSLEKEETLLKCKEAERIAQQWQDQLSEEETRRDQLQALYHLNQIVERQRRVEELQAKINGALSTQPELDKQLKEARRHLAKVWAELTRAVDLRENSLQGELVQRQKQLDQLDLEEKRLREKEKSLSAEKGAVMNWLDETRQQFDYWAEQQGPDVAKDPKAAMKRWKKERAEVIEKLSWKKKSKSELEEESERIGKDLLELAARLPDLENETKEYEKQLAEFEETQERLQSQLTRFDVFASSLFDQEERILENLGEVFSKDQAKYTAALARRYNLDEKIALSEENDYFVPHPQVEVVRQALENRGIFALSGSRWLQQYAMDPCTRWRYLWNQPLLPYGLVIESAHVEKCQNELQRLVENNEIDADFPIIMIERNEVALKPAEDTPELEPSGSWRNAGAYVHIFQSKVLEVFTSKEALDNWARQLGQRHEEVKSESEQLGQRMQDIAKLIRQAEDFYDRYNEKTIESWQARWDELKEEYRRSVNQKTQLKARANEVKSEKATIKLTIDQLDKSERDLTKRLSDIEPYVERFQKRETQLTDKNRLEKALAEVERDITSLSENRRDYERQQRELEKQLDELRQQYEARRQEMIELMGGEMDQFPPSVDDKLADSAMDEARPDFNTAAARVRGVLKALEGEKGNIQDWADNIVSLQNDIGTEEQYLQGLTVDRAWLEDNLRTVDWSEVQLQEERVKELAAKHKQARDVVHEIEGVLRDLNGALREMGRGIEEDHGRAPFDGFRRELHSEDVDRLRRHSAELKEKMTSLSHTKQSEIELHEAIIRASQYLVDEWPRDWPSVLELQSDDHENRVVPEHKRSDAPKRWDPEKRGDPESQARHVMSEIRDLLNKQTEAAHAVDRSFRDCQNAFHAVANTSLHQFARNLANLEQGSGLYNYDLVYSTFEHIFRALDQYEKQYEQMLMDIEENHKELVQRVVGRGERIIRELQDIPRYSAINLYGREARMMKIELPPHDINEFPVAMGRYIDTLIEELNQRRFEGDEDDKLRRVIDEHFSTRNILNALIPLDKCWVGVIKPQKESLIRDRRLSYESWDKVASWSGGEEYAAYMSVFIVLVTYVRRKMSGLDSSWKVIIADNPFGKASSPHILEIVFQMAERNRVQFICLTAHRDESILKYFRVVYSLKLYSLGAREVVQEERIESGYYALEEIDGISGDQQAKLVL